MEANISEGETTPPGYLTEPELIALMDANGIGTDATMAEHISKIKEREYVFTQARSGSVALTTTRGNGRGRGRGRGGRGVANGSERAGGNSLQEFIPSTLGVALIVGYEAALSPTSLASSTSTTQMNGSRDIHWVPPTPALTSAASSTLTTPLSSQTIVSLGKPFLRKELEQKLKDICEGRKGKREVVDEVLEHYKEAFVLANRRADQIKGAVRKYVLGQA